MSHLTTKILNNSPSVAGEFPSKNLSDLADAPTSPADGQTLAYNASTQSWDVVEASGGGVPVNVAVFGQRELNDYANSGFALTAGSTLSFYDTNPINNIPSDVTFNYVAGTSWLESITFQPGNYEVFAQSAAVFSSQGYMTYSLKQGTSRRTSTAVIGAIASRPCAPTFVIGTLFLTSETTVSFTIDQVSNIAASQGDFISRNATLSIRKLT